MRRPRIEPRYYPRVALSVPVGIVAAALHHDATLVNLSEGGALVQGGPALAVDARVELAFSLSEQSAPLRVSGRVVRSSGAELAVVFDELAEAAMASIRAFVDSVDPMAWDGGGPLPRALAVRFIPVIRRQAHRLARRLPTSVDVEDLVGAGFVALVEASGRFDPTVGSSFSAYALMRIRGAMLDELRGADTVSRGMRRRKAEVDATAQRLTGVLGRPPDEAEIAHQLDLTLDDYRACLMAVSIGEERSLDELPERTVAARSDAAEGIIDIAADAETVVDAAQRLERVEAALAAMPPRLKSVLEMYFGQELTMRDIGGVLGLTEGRISQLVREGLDRVRARVARGGEPTTQGAAPATAGARGAELKSST